MQRKELRNLPVVDKRLLKKETGAEKSSSILQILRNSMINRANSTQLDFHLIIVNLYESSKRSLQERTKSEVNLRSIFHSQLQSKSKLHPKAIKQFRNQRFFDIKLAPKFDFQITNCQEITSTQQDVSPVSTLQLGKKSLENDEPLSTFTLKTNRTESNNIYSAAKVTTPLNSPSKYIQKQKPVEKIEDLAEILSVCDSNASNDEDDESIVLGRLQEFASMMMPKTKAKNYQKALSQCDSIVIF